MKQTTHTVTIAGEAWRFVTVTNAAELATGVEEHGASHLAVVVDATDPDLVTQAVRLGIPILLDHMPTSDEFAAVERAAVAGEPYASPSLASSLLRVARHLALELAPPLDLTAREREILELVSRGESNRSVASALYLSEFTVRNHLGRVFRKLGVTTRAEAAQVFRGERAASADAQDGSPSLSKH